MFGDNRAAAAILRSSDPAQQKFLARNIRAFNNKTWNTSKVTLMKDILHCKFSQNLDIAKQLCATDNLFLGEAIHRDNFYGIGMPLIHKQATDKTKWQTNKLGKILMAERAVQKNTAKPVRIPLVLRTQQNYNIYCQKLIMLMKMFHSLMEFFNLIIPVLWVS